MRSWYKINIRIFRKIVLFYEFVKTWRNFFLKKSKYK